MEEIIQRMKLLEIWKRLGKQPLPTTKYQDAKVFINDKEYIITKVKYESGRWIGFEAVEKRCPTCKNNVEFPHPHTCDICTSLDQKKNYEMWEVCV